MAQVGIRIYIDLCDDYIIMYYIVHVRDAEFINDIIFIPQTIIIRSGSDATLMVSFRHVNLNSMGRSP